MGVFGYRSVASFVGVAASLYAGATFVLLNPNYPIRRTAAMIRAARLDAIIADAQGVARLEALTDVLSDLPVLLLPEQEQALAAFPEAISRPELEQAAPLSGLPALGPNDIACLLFTSGSTGVPKGVPVAHGNVLHFLHVMLERYAISESDRFSQTFDQTFDLSVFDTFMAWSSGASLHVLRPIDLVAPGRFVRKHELTVWFSVPSVAALMRKRDLLAPDSLPSLRWSLFCGEALPRSTAVLWQRAAPGSVVENLYGPTELTIACFVYRWDPETSPARCVNDVVPIGRPYPGLAAVVVGSNLNIVTPGSDGELCVMGPQTVPGYWYDDVQTRDKFRDIQVDEVPMRFYRTGDRVRCTDDGVYVYLGRLDSQIQILGHRVEFGEIAAVLRDAEGVVDAVAVGFPWKDGTVQGVVAFLVGRGIDGDRIIEHARAMLPNYLVPKAIHVIDAMPLNANGKVDRKALRERLEGDQ